MVSVDVKHHVYLLIFFWGCGGWGEGGTLTEVYAGGDSSHEKEKKIGVFVPLIAKTT